MAYNAPVAVDPAAASPAHAARAGTAGAAVEPGAAGAHGLHGPSAPAGVRGSEFENVLERAQEAVAAEPGRPPLRIDGLPGEGAPGSRELAGSEPVEESPASPAATFLDTAESGFIRLGELIAELDGSRLYNPQELLKMQLEMHRITLQIEATTKSVSEVVSGTRVLFQQQA